MELRAIKKIIFISFCLIFFLTSSFGVRWIGRAATFLREANSDESSIDKFKDYKYFAASYNFDIGEVVTITNIDTNKSLQVVISDRIKKPTGYMLFLPKETSEALAIAWQDDVYVMIDAEEKSISKDANINEISKIVEAEVFVSEPPLSQESVPIVVNNDNEDGETLIIMMLRRSVGYTPPSSIYRTPLEIVNFNEINALRWKNRLISGLYIRISTAYDENEGLRRLKQFYEIFDSIVGYEDDGKYLILMGPLEEKDIDVEIDKVRKFGYIDATVIKK